MNECEVSYLSKGYNHRATQRSEIRPIIFPVGISLWKASKCTKIGIKIQAWLSQMFTATYISSFKFLHYKKPHTWLKQNTEKNQQESLKKSHLLIYDNSLSRMGGGNWDFKFFSQGKNSIQVFSQRRKKEFMLGYKGNWEGIGTSSAVTARTT